MAATLAPSAKLQFFDASGNPLVGGKLYTYEAGTTTPLAAYTSSAGTVAAANPIILNSRGECEVWLGAGTYKLRLTTAADVDVWTVDDVPGSPTAEPPDSTLLTPAQLLQSQQDWATFLNGNGLDCTLMGFRGIPQNSQSTNYTIVAADSGKHIYHPASDANARTFTIPANSSVAFSIGTAITFINRTAQNVTIAINSDTLVQAGTTNTGSRTLAQNGVCTAVKITATEWIISGTGLS